MFKNEYLLDVDIKFKYTSRTPVFRRRDTSVLKFRFHDDSVLYNISEATNAEMTIIMPSGLTLKDTCKIIEENGQTLVQFQLQPIHTVEIGIYNIILTVENNGTFISVQPIKISIFDNLTTSDTTVLELIQDLQNQINEMEASVTDTVKLSEKGVANGVATLDENTKLTYSQLPEKVSEHIDKLMYLEGAHGFRINLKGQAQYQTPDGRYQNAGFAPYASQGVSRLILDLSVADSIITLAYSGTGSMTLQKWAYGNKNISYFANNGTVFTGNKVTIDNIGMYSFYYIDEEQNEYIKQITVVKSDIKPPLVEIYKEFGVVALMTDVEFQLKKYDKGIQTLEYFYDNGIAFPGNSIRLTEAGIYTIYYKLLNGLDYILTFEMLEEDLDI